MRTLSRPMFNMGGPIKQGIMHGIREPYRGGQLVQPGPGRPGYAGIKKKLITKIPIASNIYNKGIANLGKLWQKTKNIYKTPPSTSKELVPYDKALAAKQMPGIGTNRWWWQKAAKPTLGAVKKTGQAVLPYAGTGTLGYLGYQGAKGLFGDKTIDTTELIEDNVVRETGVPGGGDPGMKGTGEWFKKEATAARGAKAKADKEKRIADLLDTMGYDKARKNAAYDALIDAGRMVSERGTLDPKNIGRELIDPIVAATSQRFDKPEQIREAVGLLSAKAEIAKQMEDPQVAEQRRLNIEVSKKTLAGDSFRDILSKRALKGEKPTGGELAHILRNSAEGIDAIVLPIEVPAGKDALTVATERIKETWTNPELAEVKVDPGYYIVSDRVIIVDGEGNVTPYVPS